MTALLSTRNGAKGSFPYPWPPLPSDYRAGCRSASLGRGQRETRVPERTAAFNDHLDRPRVGHVLRRTYRAAELKTGRVPDLGMRCDDGGAATVAGRAQRQCSRARTGRWSDPASAPTHARDAARSSVCQT